MQWSSSYAEQRELGLPHTAHTTVLNHAASVSDLVSAGDDVRLWLPDSGTLLLSMAPVQGNAQAAAFDADEVGHAIAGEVLFRCTENCRGPISQCRQISSWLSRRLAPPRSAPDFVYKHSHRESVPFRQQICTGRGFDHDHSKSCLIQSRRNRSTMTDDAPSRSIMSLDSSDSAARWALEALRRPNRRVKSDENGLGGSSLCASREESVVRFS